jgi:serine/threonine protein kinase
MESGRVPEVRPVPGAPAPRPSVERFGRYYLLDRIGKGGMAEVFKAVTLGLEGFRRMFVVKRILAEKSRSPDFVQMFCDEARISALLHHPNIVQVYDFGHVSGSYFLAMEYLVGKDLSSVMRVLRASKLSVPPTLAAFVAQQVASGLHYAHSLRGANGKPLGIVHRDVTPSNIMLLHAGGVKILDFGVAKATALAAPAPRKSGGFLKGKLGYVSPEQARSGEADARSDIFSLGVTLWEMLAGKRLFPGANELETLSNVLSKPVPPPSTLRPGIPPELDAVVARALDRDREQRYQAADAMAADLEQILRDGRYESHSLRRLLDELFGEESSSSSTDFQEVADQLAALSPELGDQTTRAPDAPMTNRLAVELADSLVGESPAPARTATAGPSIEIEIAEASAPRPSRTRSLAPPFGVAATSDIALPTAPPAARKISPRIAMAGAAAATLLVISLAGVGIARLRGMPPPPPLATAAPAVGVTPRSAPIAAPAPAVPATVKLELDSSPHGAAVTGEAGELLGYTPVTVTLARSSGARTFTIAMAGYRSATYELTPVRDAVAMIELQRAPSSTAHHVHRKSGAARDLGDGMTINPF